MNWTKLILDVVIMAFSFNVAGIATVALNPRLMLPVCPKSIQSLAPPTKKEKSLNHRGMIIGMLFLMIFSTISAYSAGISGFWNLFFTFYIEWIVVSTSDFLILDIVLQKKFNSRLMAQGIERHPDYEFKNRMKKFSIAGASLYVAYADVPDSRSCSGRNSMTFGSAVRKGVNHEQAKF